jgi:hypothetical protein
MSNTEPCGIGGSTVGVVVRKGEMSMADATPPIEYVRVCSNPTCASNTGEMSLGDAV